MIYTFGHSTQSLEQARRLLREEGVNLLVDVRSHPGSSHVPQWNREHLEQEFGSFYVWLPQLGGWSEELPIHDAELELARAHGVDVDLYLKGFFPKGRIARKTPEKLRHSAAAPFWTVMGFYDYSFFMATDAFQTGVIALLDLAEHHNVAIMCAELHWWRCHRSMVADALAYRGVEVYHLQPSFMKHRLEDRLARYHPAILRAWDLTASA